MTAISKDDCAKDDGLDFFTILCVTLNLDSRGRRRVVKILREKHKTCKCVLNNGFEQSGMKLPKYNLRYNTRDQLRSLVISASERKHESRLI